MLIIKNAVLAQFYILLSIFFFSVSTLKAEEKEEDLLDMAWGLESASRLSCQAIVDKVDLVIEIPKYTINHARENH